MCPCRKHVVEGPLAAYADGFGEALRSAGYAAGTVGRYGRLLAALSGWLTAHDIAPGRCSQEVVGRFAAAQRGRGQLVELHALRPLLAYLRSVGVVPPPPASPEVAVLTAFARYLTAERRLAPLTVTGTVGVVRRLLATLPEEGEFAELTAGQVHRLVRVEADRLSIGATRATLSALRVFLRFLFATGRHRVDLSVVVPAVAGVRLSGLPRAVDAATVAALLTVAGTGPAARRDVAILTLQVRLGLRANEIATLRLEDLDWRAGELVVHGKGGRDERLPLPTDVGQALVDYLVHERGRAPARAVFLRAAVPAGPMSRNAVVMVSRTASRRAGLPVVGGHQLRHTAATNMLRAGASLGEIGQVLRHVDDATTAIYAKVDQAALASIARCWPEPAR
jgi:integrase/recombinase XerD